MFKIEKSVPMPMPSGKGRPRKSGGIYATLCTLQVGESFTVPGRIQRNTIAGCCSTLKRTKNLHFVTRKEGNKVRVWRFK